MLTPLSLAIVSTSLSPLSSSFILIIITSRNLFNIASTDLNIRFVQGCHWLVSCGLAIWPSSHITTWYCLCWLSISLGILQYSSKRVAEYCTHHYSLRTKILGRKPLKVSSKWPSLVIIACFSVLWLVTCQIFVKGFRPGFLCFLGSNGILSNILWSLKI